MIPHHVYYLFMAMGCLWLCILLHYPWPNRSPRSHLGPAEPVPPKFKHKRSNASKPCKGPTQRPHCAVCDHDPIHPQAPPEAGAPRVCQRGPNIEKVSYGATCSFEQS